MESTTYQPLDQNVLPQLRYSVEALIVSIVFGDLIALVVLLFLLFKFLFFFLFNILYTKFDSIVLSYCVHLEVLIPVKRLLPSKKNCKSLGFPPFFINFFSSNFCLFVFLLFTEGGTALKVLTRFNAFLKQ